ncbi:MAG: glycosyltransferase family 117 protein, partial [Gemmatimonadaceae bacterium]
PDAERPSYAMAAIVALGALALYVATMAPSTAMWDTSEYIAAAYSFGLPHPPGNPFFVILGHVFSFLPIAPNVAARVNLLAALSSAIAAGVWCLVTEHVLRSWIEARWLRRAGAIAGALIGATAFTVWNQSVVNEKVYTVSLAGIALVSWLAIRWSDDPQSSGADRRLVMMAYLCGLGYANHMAGMLPAPAIAAVVLIRRPGTLTRWRLLLACLVALAAGVTPFATQPIRAAYFPAMDEGEPTACHVALEWSCTFSMGTLQAFKYNFDRGQFGKPDLSDRQATFGQQVGMWWLYFKWQWLRDADARYPFAQALLAAVFLVLGLFGGWVHFQRDRKSFWFFGALMFT